VQAELKPQISGADRIAMMKRKKTGGRSRGTPNKTTALLKDAIVRAADNIGSDKNGKDGLTGYFQIMALEDPKSFAMLLGKILPTQLTGEGGGPVEVKKSLADVYSDLKSGS
jgi:hypothetical protein